MMLREPWRTRLLFGSFAVNLFLVGVLGTHWAGRPVHGPPGSEAFIAHMTQGMPPGDAERFRGVMQQARRDNDLARAHMEVARGELSRAIGSNPYDEAKVRAAMQSWQAAWIEWSNALGASMVKAIAGLSPDGRHSLAEAGQRPPTP